MRRLLTLWTALSILAAVSGCRHIAGECDCCGSACNYGSPPAYVINSTPAPPAIQPEPLKRMPQEIVPAPAR